jgi:hypothetical protein
MSALGTQDELGDEQNTGSVSPAIGRGTVGPRPSATAAYPERRLNSLGNARESEPSRISSEDAALAASPFSPSNFEGHLIANQTVSCAPETQPTI